MVTVGVLACLASACGSSGGATEVVATTTSVSGAAPSDAPSSASPTTPPATTAPATTAPPTTAPATTAPAPAPAPVAGGLSLDCLQGEWLLDNGTTDLFIATLVPFAPVSVPSGSISMRFDGDRVVYFVNIVVRFTVPQGEVQGPLDLRQDGRATVSGNQLLISDVATTGGWGNFTGTVGGVSVDVPMPPLGEFPTVAGGPATCAGNRFSLQYTSGVADAVAYFTKAG